VCSINPNFTLVAGSRPSSGAKGFPSRLRAVVMDNSSAKQLDGGSVDPNKAIFQAACSAKDLLDVAVGEASVSWRSWDGARH
jgi:hypothetical protein